MYSLFDSQYLWNKMTCSYNSCAEGERGSLYVFEVTTITLSCDNCFNKRFASRSVTLNGDRSMEVLFNEDSEDDLIPESESCGSSDICIFRTCPDK
jgi:hypothetical protein